MESRGYSKKKKLQNWVCIRIKEQLMEQEITNKNSPPFLGEV